MNSIEDGSGAGGTDGTDGARTRHRNPYRSGPLGDGLGCAERLGRLDRRRGVTIAGRVREAAGVESVYGDPLTVDGRIVIPVARVVYGFGGGYTSPVGVLETTDFGTQFVEFGTRRRLLGAFVAGALAGAALGHRLAARKG